MVTLHEALAFLRGLAPEESALDNDPVGLLITSPDAQDVARIGVCLDLTPAAARRAAEARVDLVIAHHPLLYHPLKRIDPGADPISAAAVTLVKHNIALYAMHTNWDRAADGINDTLAHALELRNIMPLGHDGAKSLPRLGDLPSPMDLDAFFAWVAARLDGAGTNALRINRPDGAAKVARVAVCGGAGAFLTSDVLAAGADAYVTSDVRHHEFLDAAARGLALLDAGHDGTETPGMRRMAEILTKQFPNVETIWLGNPKN
ncbi:GTP cyclohydrolase 1 type 2 [Capsulimonas corticalis]|uniref:GTP cyclohydrolase 1 type 2 homolog n=1 Tax=Capsulimonas corticalis TaxID=2219043 RepID=A0A402D2R6_9BACT|nr:Nif3-like dinuclear metal center hexameric protein [Capsulimonas corticalis]BDI28423.1 GTP cyclohydrolase 1 type 2 [Capsulimonas corticalis]